MDIVQVCCGIPIAAFMLLWAWSAITGKKIRIGPDLRQPSANDRAVRIASEEHQLKYTMQRGWPNATPREMRLYTAMQKRLEAARNDPALKDMKPQAPAYSSSASDDREDDGFEMRQAVRDAIEDERINYPYGHW